MKRKYIGALAIAALAAFLFGPSPALGQVDPTLGLTTFRRYAVLGGAGVTGSTTAGTVVNGDVGSSPTATILEFVGSTIPGPSRTAAGFTVHYTNDLDVQQAILQARTAWNNMGAQGLLPGAIALGPELSNVTLNGGGIYNFATTANIASPGGVVTGTLTLNGGPNDIYIFNVGSSLTANVNSVVAGTANPCNIFWRMGPGGSATLNGNTFRGTVIADQAVTVASSNPAGTIFTQFTGRAVGIIAAVTMPGAGGNTIGGCSAPILPCPIVTVSPASLPAGAIGTAYNQTITASGGLAPYTFAVTGTLPNGLTLAQTSPTTAAITGTPTTSGNFNFRITATDANTCSGFRDYSIAIVCPVITLSPATLPGVTVGTAYNQTISATGGTAPYTFSVATGALPNGLTLNSATGAITGTPTAPGGLLTFRITATDANTCSGFRDYSIAAVVPGIPTLSPIALAILMLLLAGAGLFIMNRFSM